MVEPDTFQVLLQRVRQKDQEASAELLRQYGPAIQRAIRSQLRSSARMRRTTDTMDISQSVFCKFFVRVALGEFDLDKPEQLLGLLLKIVKDKVIDKHRKGQAGVRDDRRLEAAGAEQVEAVASSTPTPSRILAGRELLAEVRQRLTEQERYLANQRAEGRPWNELAGELGESEDALRKRLTRALDRVMRELNLEDDHE